VLSLTVGLVYGLASDPLLANDPGNAVFESHYLTPTVAGYHGITFAGEIGGAGQLILDPNACTLDPFGDRGVCTEIALVHRPVRLVQLEIHDPTGNGRMLFQVDGHGFDGDFRLVVTKGNEDAWFVLTNRAGERTIIALDRRTLNPKLHRESGGKSCAPLARTVDGDVSQGKLVPGFINDTWIVIVAGKKLYLGTTVALDPLTYVRQPEYWEIEVKECSDGITIPLISPYVASRDVTATMGTKGIELVFANERVRLELPNSKP
jgi:hypothetical protein